MATLSILVVGDSGPGTCYDPSHSGAQSVTGTITDSPLFASINGITISGDGSTVQLSCGHTGTMIASSSVSNNGIKLCREGDLWTDGTSVTDGTIDTPSQAAYTVE